VGYLVVVQGPWQGVELALSPGEHVLGRDPECSLAIPDAVLSRRHVRFFAQGDDWVVEDLGSRNGTTLNDARVATQVLRPGDVVVAGRTTLRYEAGQSSALAGEPGSSTTIVAMATPDEPSAPGPGGFGAGGGGGPRLESLLGLSEALAEASGLEALGERVARWLLVETGGKDAVLFRRRGSRLLAVAAYTPTGRGQARAVVLPPQAVKDVLDEGRTILIERAGAKDAIVPIGVPAELVVATAVAGQPSPSELRFLAMGGRLAAGFLAGQLRLESLASRAAAPAEDEAEEPIAVGAAMRPVIDFVDRVAASDVTVLLLGESGTGKDVVARAIHHASPRARGPFVAINCAALPDSLVEAELFGHEKGAFTGALARRIGHFEAAHGGTLFLDEVAELSPGAQARLLRVLEDRQVQRLGASSSVAVDVRVIAATHQDLKQAVSARRFRQDLYFRLAVLVQPLPPLRERREDVEPLARRFLDRLRGRAGRPVEDFSPRALDALRAHAWPGNVRELRNAVERAVILGRTPLIEPADLPLDVTAAGAAGAAGPDRSTDALDTLSLPAPLAEVERRAVLAAMRATAGNKTQAARLLGVDRVTLYSRLKQYGAPAADGDDS
jgi:DNA-binding NtrC family response regulator